MIFSLPITDLIEKRHSIRTYSSIPVSPDIKQRIVEYSNSVAQHSFANLRFCLIESDSILPSRPIIGTYGTILGARTFIAAICGPSKNDLISTGSSLENIILFLTSLGLSTCWLGGTFNRNKLAHSIQLNSNEIIPAITPVGYPNKIRGPFDLLLKPIPSYRSRKPWSNLFFDNNFSTPLSSANSGAFAKSLEMLRLSPSASNQQPWRIVRIDNIFHFYLCHSSIYKQLYSFDMQFLDIGISMFHFEQTSIEQGLIGSWKNVEPQIKNKSSKFEYISSWLANR